MDTATSIAGRAGSPAGRAGTLVDRSRIVGLGREVATFGLIGVVSTLAYVALYKALRSATPPGVANALALVVTAVGNTAANRRLTFGVRGRQSFVRDQAAGLAAFGIALALTSGAIAVLGWLVPAADRSTEVVVLVLANALATAVRFALLRGLIATPNRLEGSPS